MSPVGRNGMIPRSAGASLFRPEAKRHDPAIRGNCLACFVRQDSSVTLPRVRQAVRRRVLDNPEWNNALPVRVERLQQLDSRCSYDLLREVVRLRESIHAWCYCKGFVREELCSEHHMYCFHIFERRTRRRIEMLMTKFRSAVVFESGGPSVLPFYGVSESEFNAANAEPVIRIGVLSPTDELSRAKRHDPAIRGNRLFYLFGRATGRYIAGIGHPLEAMMSLRSNETDYDLISHFGHAEV